MRRANILTSLLLSLLAVLTPLSDAIALPDDRNQPIKIKSNRADRNEKSGVTIYSGQVTIDQGSLHISADKVVIETEENEVTRIIATGKPAYMNQRPSLDKTPVKAHGNTIKYFIDKDLMTLLDDASIEQQGSIVSSERIDYFLLDERVKAQGGNLNESNKRRVEMVIPAKKSVTE